MVCSCSEGSKATRRARTSISNRFKHRSWSEMQRPFWEYHVDVVGHQLSQEYNAIEKQKVVDRRLRNLEHRKAELQRPTCILQVICRILRHTCTCTNMRFAGHRATDRVQSAPVCSRDEPPRLHSF